MKETMTKIEVILGEERSFEVFVAGTGQLGRAVGYLAGVGAELRVGRAPAPEDKLASRLADPLFGRAMSLAGYCGDPIAPADLRVDGVDTSKGVSVEFRVDPDWWVKSGLFAGDVGDDELKRRISQLSSATVSSTIEKAILYLKDRLRNGIFVGEWQIDTSPEGIKDFITNGSDGDLRLALFRLVRLCIQERDKATASTVDDRLRKEFEASLRAQGWGGDTLVACPKCKGLHFNVTRDGKLVCYNRSLCGFVGKLEDAHVSLGQKAHGIPLDIQEAARTGSRNSSHANADKALKAQPAPRKHHLIVSHDDWSVTYWEDGKVEFKGEPCYGRFSSMVDGSIEQGGLSPIRNALEVALIACSKLGLIDVGVTQPARDAFYYGVNMRVYRHPDHIWLCPAPIDLIGFECSRIDAENVVEVLTIVTRMLGGAK